jgi:hypothetical protein
MALALKIRFDASGLWRAPGSGMQRSNGGVGGQPVP